MAPYLRDPLSMNLKLDELAAKGAHEFAFATQSLRIQGGSGSTVVPAAGHDPDIRAG